MAELNRSISRVDNQTQLLDNQNNKLNLIFKTNIRSISTDGITWNPGTEEKYAIESGWIPVVNGEVVKPDIVRPIGRVLRRSYVMKKMAYIITDWDQEQLSQLDQFDIEFNKLHNNNIAVRYLGRIVFLNVNLMQKYIVSAIFDAVGDMVKADDGISPLVYNKIQRTINDIDVLNHSPPMTTGPDSDI